MRIFICLAAVLPLVGMNTRPPNTTQKPRSTERPVNATSAGRLEEVRLDRVKHSTLDIFNPVGEAGVVSWRRTKERGDAVSDMVFHDGKLFVAGLSNEEFSSAMRIYPFPFEGPGATTTLEIYHGSHA
jgi:hypothetical protein